MDPLRRVMTWSRLPRRTLRLQLTLLYGGVLVALLVAVLGVWGLLYGTSSKAAPGSPRECGSRRPGPGCRQQSSC